MKPGLALASSLLPCVIMLSAWVSLKVRFPQEPVSKGSQRRMLTERAGKEEAAILLSSPLLSPPSPSSQQSALCVAKSLSPAPEGFGPSSRTRNWCCSHAPSPWGCLRVYALCILPGFTGTDCWFSSPVNLSGSHLISA